METIILFVHVVIAVGLIGLILLQQGKGADAGASFGGGASQTFFGSQGNVGFLAKITGLLAFVLFATSFGLAVIAKDKASILADGDTPLPEAIEQAVEQQQQVETDLPVLDASNDNPAADLPSSDDLPNSGDLPETPEQ